eukprot:2075463-Amphidinium_carterae.1
MIYNLSSANHAIDVMLRLVRDAPRKNSVQQRFRILLLTQLRVHMHLAVFPECHATRQSLSQPHSCCNGLSGDMS